MMSFVKDYVARRRSKGDMPENEDYNDDGDEKSDAAYDAMSANDSLASFPSGSPSNHSHSAPSSYTYTSTSAHQSTMGPYSNESQVKNNSTRRQKNNCWLQLTNF